MQTSTPAEMEPAIGAARLVIPPSESKSERVTPSSKRKLFASPFTCTAHCTASNPAGGCHVKGCRLRFSETFQVELEQPGPDSNCVVWFAKVCAEHILLPTAREAKVCAQHIMLPTAREAKGCGTDIRYIVKIGDQQRICNEVRIMEHLASRNAPVLFFGQCVAWLLDECVDRGYVALYMHEKSVDLIDFIKLRPDLPLSWRLAICIKLTALVFSLHSLDVAHLDLKPDNVLITLNDGTKDKWHLSLIDYDASVIHPLTSKEPHAPRNRAFGTQGYEAPEVKYDAPFFPYLADKWSLGITLHTVLTSQTICPDLDDIKQVKEIQELLVLKRFAFHKSIPPSFVDILGRLLSDAKSRDVGLDTIQQELFVLFQKSFIIPRAES